MLNPESDLRSSPQGSEAATRRIEQHSLERGLGKRWSSGIGYDPVKVGHPTATSAHPSLVVIDGEDQSFRADLIAEVGGLATWRGCKVYHRHTWSGVDRVPDGYRGCVLNMGARRKRAGFDPIGALDLIDRVADRVGIAVKSDSPTRVVPRVDRESGDFGRVPLADEIGLEPPGKLERMHLVIGQGPFGDSSEDGIGESGCSGALLLDQVDSGTDGNGRRHIRVEEFEGRHSQSVDEPLVDSASGPVGGPLDGGIDRLEPPQHPVCQRLGSRSVWRCLASGR